MNKSEKLSASLDLLKRRGEDLMGEELRNIWKEILSRFPELSRVEIIVPDKDKTLSYTGGEFILPNEENPDPAIVILPADDSLYEKLKETRPLAIKIAGDLVNKEVKEMSGEDIKKFIFLHEVGHAYDFISNFENDPQIGEEMSVYTWNMLRYEEMSSLPIPHYDPNDLNMFITSSGIKEVADLIQKQPEIENRIKELNISTIQELLDRQEISYRKLQKEAFADQFAGRFFYSR